jgi:hypothetical protein
MKPASLVATLFLAVIALGHLLRILFQVELTIGRTSVPLWMSGAAFLFTGGLAILLWREGRKS